MDHSEISTMALVAWNLPRPIRAAVRYHHTPGEDPTPLTEGRTLRLSALLSAADEFADHMGIAVTPKNMTTDAPSPEEFVALMGVAADEVSAAFGQEFDAIKTFF
jgi:hypothetical protein